jgi:CheY-like chemotaxis protein
VKFTPQAGRVQLALTQRDSRIQLTVTDTGRGIEASFLPHVFERFQQADGTSTRAYGGLGLGLAICRHIVELHGGTIEARSDGPSQGSTFTVTLPIVRLPLQEPAGPQAAPILGGEAMLECPPELRGLKVLVVDDEPDARELVVSVLTQCAAVTMEASSALEALNAMSGHPDVIVADIGMPSIDGYELLRRVRALPPSEGGRTPAAALTAYVRAEDRRLAMKSGFEMFIPKPVEPAELLAVVATLARIGQTII